MNAYQLLSLVLGLSTTAGILFYFQAFKHKQNNTIDALAAETREAITLSASKVAGLQDHISNLRQEYAHLQHEMAEFTASIDPDVVDKFKDRLAIVEMTVGVRRLDQVRKVASEKP